MTTQSSLGGLWKKYLTEAVFACDGLASPPWVTLLTSFWKLACLVFRGDGLTQEDVISVQGLCDGVINGLLRLGGSKKNSDLPFFDLPSLHGLAELCYRTLPVLRNGNFSSTTAHETHHASRPETVWQS